MDAKKQLVKCGFCGKEISYLAFKMVISNKPYLMCKCKKEKVVNFK